MAISHSLYHNSNSGLQPPSSSLGCLSVGSASSLAGHMWQLLPAPYGLCLLWHLQAWWQRGCTLQAGGCLSCGIPVRLCKSVPAEYFWIMHYDTQNSSGYNICKQDPMGSGSCAGWQHWANSLTCVSVCIACYCSAPPVPCVHVHYPLDISTQ